MNKNCDLKICDFGLARIDEAAGGITANMTVRHPPAQHGRVAANEMAARSAGSARGWRVSPSPPPLVLSGHAVSLTLY